MPDEVRLLNNADALLFVRGERAMRDRKIDLLKHRNIHLTTDGGYTPYTSTTTKMQVLDISYDPARHSDYDLLTEEDLIDPSESKKPIYYEISEEN